MSKLLTLSLVAVLTLSTALPLAISNAAAAGLCNTDHVCDLDNPGDPGNPGEPGNPGDPGDNGKPYVDPNFPEVADNGPRQLLIACRVKGEPAGLPDDIRFRNIGDATIPASTRIYWLVKETGAHGFYTVPVDLAVGDETTLAGILPVGLPTTDHCYSKIM